MAKRLAQGLNHLYTGDGKGKTSAAVGLAVRALGAGLRVTFSQFMKGGRSGELAMLSRIGATVVHLDATEKFVFAMNAGERMDYGEIQNRIFTEAAARTGESDVLVLDEVISAITTGMIAPDRVVDCLRTKPEGLEVILTGRDAPPSILDLMDYISWVKCERHPYDKGVGAREGIEF